MGAQDKVYEAAPRALSDAELADVAGGYSKYHDEDSDRYYIWSSGVSVSNKYLCPNCGRPVTPDFLCIKWSCKPCDSSWVFEFRLKPNLAAGGWRWVTKEEYDRCTDKSPLDR